MEELVIHIGTHKTGSTAIQKTLLENRDFLSGRGIHYPDIGFHYYGHHALQAALERDDAREHARIAAALHAVDGKVVLSSENFSRCQPKSIETLACMVKGTPVRVIYYQRNVLDMVYVWWQEIVKHGSTKTFLHYYAECLTRPFSQHILSPRIMLDRWGKVFGRQCITIHLYDEIANVADQFMRSVLGMADFVASKETMGVNKSFDVPSTEFIRCLNLGGIRGVTALMEDAAAKSLRDRVRAASTGKLESLQVDFDCFIFNRIEADLASAWSDRIPGAKPGARLFSKRSSTLSYIDASFWFGEPALAAEINTYAAASANRAQGRVALAATR